MAIKDANKLGEALNHFFNFNNSELLNLFEAERRSETLEIQNDAVHKRNASMQIIKRQDIIENQAYK